MTPAQAMLAVAFLASHDSDEILYRYPPPVGDDQAEGYRLSQHAQDAFAAADARGATEADWAAAVRWCESADVPNVGRPPGNHL